MTQILILALPLDRGGHGQTHALLVGYLDLSVGGMIGLGVVIASFLIGAEASVSEILIGVGGRSCSCGVALGLVNAGLIRGLKIPSIIATLATLSILDGISLTLRPTAQGVIDRDLMSVLTASGSARSPSRSSSSSSAAGLLDYGSTPPGRASQVRAVGFDERSAKRSGVRTNWVRVRALLLVGAARGRGLVLRHGPVRRSGTRRSATPSR